MTDIRCLLGFHKWVRKPVDVANCVVTDDNELGGYDEWVNEAEITFEPRMCPRCNLLNKADSEELISLLIKSRNIRRL